MSPHSLLTGASFLYRQVTQKYVYLKHPNIFMYTYTVMSLIKINFFIKLKIKEVLSATPDLTHFY